MGLWKLVSFAIMLFLATSDAAPTNDESYIEISEECVGKDYCTSKPKDTELLEKNMIDVLSPTMDKDQNSEQDTIYTDRFGNAGIRRKSSGGCRSIEKTESMYDFFRTMNQPNINMDLLVQRKLFNQTITTVTCDSDNVKHQSGNYQCFSEELSTLVSKSSCKQIYAKRTLLVYNPVTLEVESKPYTVHVSCACVIE